MDIRDLVEQALRDALDQANIEYNGQYLVQLALKVERDYYSGYLEQA